MADVLPDNEVSRLRWQCRRGMLELDALLGDFVEQHYTQLEAREREVFKDVLNLPDQLLFDYFFGNGKSIDKDVNNVIERIRCAITPKA